MMNNRFYGKAEGLGPGLQAAPAHRAVREEVGREQSTRGALAKKVEDP